MKKPVILCVDDEKIVLDSLRAQLLQLFGGEYGIELAESGEEGLEVLDELIYEEHNPPHLIISDQLMPGMKGDEFLAKAQQIAPKTKSILLTGQAGKEDIIRAINNAGLYRYISKPWDKEDLYLTAKEAIDSFLKSKKIEEQRDQLLDANQNLEQKVEERTEEVRQQKEELITKNKEIIDSLNYAKKIQTVMLPESLGVSEPFESFILFKPLLIVSGDFYWYLEKDGLIYFSVIDCTGHGVPGAFMTVIANNLLYDAVHNHKITEPNVILEHIHQGVVKTLKQQTSEVMDGMDISLVVIDQKNSWVKFAGANHTLVYLQDGQLNEIKGDKFSIGGFTKIERNFSSHQITISTPTTFYMFTDGYQDQFGGARSKKFLFKHLREKFLQIHQLPMEEQREHLVETFESWKGPNDQIDDVLVVGFRLN